MATTTRAIDPVCDMDHSDTTYYFCERACAETFNEEPERWVQPEVARRSTPVES